MSEGIYLTCNGVGWPEPAVESPGNDGNSQPWAALLKSAVRVQNSLTPSKAILAGMEGVGVRILVQSSVHVR